MSSEPATPSTANPIEKAAAKKPKEAENATADNILLGGEEELLSGKTVQSGKKLLRRPITKMNKNA